MFVSGPFDIVDLEVKWRPSWTLITMMLAMMKVSVMKVIVSMRISQPPSSGCAGLPRL